MATPSSDRFVLRDTLAWVIRRSGARMPTPVFTPRFTGDTAVDAPSSRGTESMAAGALVVLAALALAYTLYLARSVAMPITVSILLSFLLRAPVRWLRRKGLREPWGAALVVLGAVLLITASLTMLAAPAREWVGRVPTAITTIEARVRPMLAPVLTWEAAATRVTRLADGAAPGAVEVRPPSAVGVSVVRRVFGSMTNGIIVTVSITFLTYFLLASGDLFLRKLMRVLPYDPDNHTLPQKVSDDVEVAVSRYLRTSVFINVSLGLATWGMLALLGMPNAGLWGMIAGLLNFVPYLGALLTTGILALAAVTVFETPGRMLLVPGAFLALNVIESNIVTPVLMGRQFPLNTVALFVGVMFWQFVWGVPGAILAVPILVTLKLMCDAIPQLHAVGEFLGP